MPKFTDTRPGRPGKTDSELAIWPSPTTRTPRATLPTEIVKYFLQQHYNLGVDLTRPDLLRKGNFYGGN